MSKQKERLVVGYDVPEGLVMVTALDWEGAKLASREYDLNNLPEAIRDKVSCYGLNKLLTDRTSDQKDKVAKLVVMDEVYNLLVGGEWAKERVVGAIVVGVEVEALAELKGWAIAFTQTTLAQYPKEDRAKILGSAQVQGIAKRLRAQRKDATIASLDDMLS